MVVVQNDQQANFFYFSFKSLRWKFSGLRLGLLLILVILIVVGIYFMNSASNIGFIPQDVANFLGTLVTLLVPTLLGILIAPQRIIGESIDHTQTASESVERLLEIIRSSEDAADVIDEVAGGLPYGSARHDLVTKTSELRNYRKVLGTVIGDWSAVVPTVAEAINGRREQRATLLEQLETKLDGK